MPNSETAGGNPNYQYENESLDTGANNIAPVDGVDYAPRGTGGVGVDNFASNVQAILAKDNPWLASNEYQTPYNTRLKDTLRYDDSEKGFDPFNVNLEYQYGDDQGMLSKWKNNVLKFGAGTVGSFVEGMASIPLVLNAAANGDLNKIENNSLTNGVTDWLDSLETKLPNYETSFGRDHPIANYIPFLGNSGDSWGGVLKNLGFTVGSIGAAVVTDIAVGALTEGVGAVPLVGVQLTKAMGKLGKIVGAGSKSVESFTKLMQGGKTIEEALSTMSASAKALDKVRYGISLGTSALSESMIEANQTQGDIDKQLKEDYFQVHGYDAQGSELETIKHYSKEGANAALIANFGLLLATESTMFSSLLNPSSVARAELAAAADEKISVELAKGSLDVFKEVDPIKGFKGILKKAANSEGLKSFFIEGGQEGAQFVIQTAADNFYKNKFDSKSIFAVDNFIQSIGKGLYDVVNTREGVENIVLGGLTGIIIAPVTHLIQKRLGISPDPKDRLAYVIKTLNDNPLTGLFTDKFNSAVTAYNLSNKQLNGEGKGNGLRQEDLYETHNDKFQQLFNFINAGIRTNRLESQLERLNSIKDLNEKEQRDLLKITDPDVTKAQIDQHIDSLIAKAADIKSDIQKVDKAFSNPYNRRTQRDEFEAFDNLKDSMAVALSEMKDNRLRMSALGIEVGDKLHSTNLNKIVNLTNEDGINQTIKDFEDRIKELDSDTELMKGSPSKVRDDVKKEKEFLQRKVEDLKTHLESINPDLYVQSLQEIYNYYNNGNSTEGENKIDFIDAINVHNKAVDIFKLGQGTKIAEDFFGKLSNKENFNKHFELVKAYATAAREATAEENAAREAAAASAAATGKPGAVKADDVVESAENQEIDDKGNVIVKPAATAASTSTEVATGSEGADESFDPDAIDAEIAKKKAATEKKVSPKDEKKIAEVEAQLAEAEAANEKERESIENHLISLKQPKAKAAEAAKRQAEISPLGKKVAALRKKLAELKGEPAAGKKEKGATPEKTTGTGTTGTETTTATEPKPEKPAPEPKEPKEEKPKEEKPMGIKVEPLKGTKKFSFNPMWFFNRLFSKTKKEKGKEHAAKVKLLLTKSIAEIAGAATLKVTESTEGLKFGEYRALSVDGGPSNLFFTGYQHDMSLEFNGSSIGLLQPVNRIFFKRGDEYVAIHDIKKEEYAAATGNSEETYDDFMTQVKAYQAATDKIISEFKGGKTEFSNAEISNLFNLKIDYGFPTFTNSADEATLLKNVKYDQPGNAILSLQMEPGEDGAMQRGVPRILNKNLTEEQFRKLSDFIDANIDGIKRLNSRYIFIAQLPNGEYGRNSIIAARPAQAEATKLEDLFKLLKSNPKTKEEAANVNATIAEEFYIADSTNSKGKGAKMFLTTDVGGQLYLNIINKNVKYRVGGVEKIGYSRRIQLPQASQASDINGVITGINNALAFQKKTDSALNSMGIILAKSDIKSGILQDEDVSVDELKNKLTIPVPPSDMVERTTQLFENPEVFMIPKGIKPMTTTNTETKAAPKTATPEAPKAAAPVAPETKTSTAMAQSFLKDKEAKAKAREEAKNQTSQEVEDDFLNSLGCK